MIRSDMDSRTVSWRQLRVSLSSDSRYMPSLMVFKGNKPCGSNHLKIQDRIVASLKLLTFREQHVLVQFWWSHEVGKHQLLTTLGQPFGMGSTDVRLRTYRQDSDRKSVFVDKDHEKKDHSPVARVYRRGLPEWTSDLNNYTPKHFQQQECAINCDFHGYLALPLFDSKARLCIGVLELLASSKYMDYAHEVQQIHTALKKQNLISSQGFGFPPIYVPNERTQNYLDKIHVILKMVCDIHNLPLSQTWTVCQHGSFVSHEKVIHKSCSSFDSRCVGKVCMFTADLPFYVKDLDMWSFRNACRERHLDRSSGLVGKALLTRGSCFCGDVTELSEEEYPLVHHARMNGLTSCFAIFLHSVGTNEDYVLEFFLSPDINDSWQVLNLVQTLKQNIPVGSGFILGDNSCIQVVGENTEPDVIDISSGCMADQFTSSDSESSSMATGSTDTEEKGKKRKIESVAELVTAQIYFNDDMKVFHFSISSGLSYLKKEVSQSFKLKGKKLILKYMDKDDDLILIACDADLELAVVTTAINNSINLACLLG